MKKPAPDTLTSRIRKLIAEGWSNPEIACTLGCSVKTVSKRKWEDTNREHRSARDRALRHRKGGKPRVGYKAAQRAQMEKRWAKVKPLLDQGLSYSGAARKLGLTRNAVAGLKHRANGAEGCP